MRYDGQSILKVIMSCTKKTQDDAVSSDAKLQAEMIPSKETSTMETINKSNGTLPIPMIPEDDMDESEEGFPLITSVFSLASSESSDSQKSPGKESTEMTSRKDSPPSVSLATGGSPTRNGGNVSPRLFRPLAASKPKPAVDNKTGPDRNNAPYYVGKGKLILPKPKIEDNKTQASLSQSTMAFSQIMSFGPQNNNTINSSTTTVGKEGTSQAPVMMTRSAAHKINSQPNTQVGSSVTGIAAPVYQTQSVPATSTSQPKVVKLANTAQFLNVKNAPGQATFPVRTPNTSSESALSSSVLSSSSPLAKLIKSISPNTTLTNVSLTPTTTVASTTHAPVVVTPVVSAPGNSQMWSARPINIAPAPVQQMVASTPSVNTGNAPRYVVVSKTGVSASNIPVTQVVSAKGGGVNIPKVFMVPNTASTQGAKPGTQVLYLFENQGAGDGKTYRILIPDRKVAGQPTTTVPSQSPVPIITSNNGSIVSNTQLVRIIPKPVTTTVVNQQPKVPIVTQTASPTVVNLNTKKAATVLNASSTTIASTKVSTQKPTEKGPTAEKSSSEIPTSAPSPSEDAEPSVESIDTGLSPHEARIQKLKELLKKQEEAIDRLKQKRQKEIDDVRAPPVESSNSEGATSKRDSPFAVPLPPKKARLDQYRSKLSETNRTVQDGFLPNTDDTQFVKLVGLEKVVDKLKAKKMQELKEVQALNSLGNNTTS